MTALILWQSSYFRSERFPTNGAGLYEATVPDRDLTQNLCCYITVTYKTFSR